MFLKFRCGCVAFPTPNKDGQHLVVRPCDSDDDLKISFYWRSLLEPGEGEPLTEEEEKQIVHLISTYIHDGKQFQSLRIILGIE